ncbi:MAG: hypothetical protein CMM01_26660 [Rhodopirellula sp.]|nr:hypothetical protein [Rhodopirellula sp.]
MTDAVFDALSFWNHHGNVHRTENDTTAEQKGHSYKAALIVGQVCFPFQTAALLFDCKIVLCHKPF